ncbi:hypothetical protein [Limibacillus sp. MBR-115]|jgi:hypothetical protein|uniref:hypothetical protein n=1 Tax=Limibacillus sp. MBR-115 TaxID=3156465 RepID=UPI003397D4E9
MAKNETAGSFPRDRSGVTHDPDLFAELENFSCSTTGRNMAMQRNTYSISGLATELGMDRRTVASRLSGVPADHVDARGKRWTLVRALPHLQLSHAPAPSGPAGHFRPLGEPWKLLEAAPTPFDKGASLAFLLMLYNVGDLVKAAAKEKEIGLTYARAEKLAGLLFMLLWHTVATELGRVGLEPFASDPESIEVDLATAGLEEK